MKKSQIIALVICTMFSVVVIFSLYVLSPIGGKLQRGGFMRKSFNRAVISSSLDLGLPSFYIAGIVDSIVYLGNTTAINHLVHTTVALQDSQRINLKLGIDSARNPESFRLLIDSPYYYLVNGTDPTILTARLGNWFVAPVKFNARDFFTEAVPISTSSFAFRSYSTINNEYEIGKKNLDTFYFNDGLLVKQVDGLFCLDGKMHYQKHANQLVFLHFYRNEYIVMDTLLRLRYRSHTIDTCRHASVQVASVEKGRQKMLAKPPVPVNGSSCVDGNRLYVQSMIPANNDDAERYLHSATIDVYDLTAGKYEGTFYVPKFNHQQLSSFQVFGKMIFGIFGDHLVRYDFIR